MNISVITPSLPSRRDLLARAMASVATQKRKPIEHLIGVDHVLRGPAIIRNELITAASGDWLAFLDDDDMFGLEHLDILGNAAANSQADVIIPYCLFEGPPLQRGYCNRPFDARALQTHGIFPITVLARKAAVEAVGCFPIAARYEDWELWNLMLRNKARFYVVPVRTWTYRTLGSERRTHAPKPTILDDAVEPRVAI